MSLRQLLNRTAAAHAARADHRAIERALLRAVTPDHRQELLVLEASRR